MAVPSFTKNPLQVKTGPGLILFSTNLAVTLPVFAAAASKFTNDWTGFGKVGYTDSGLTITFGRETEGVEVSESIREIRKVTTGANIQVAFDASGINEDNIKNAMAGGTWSTVSGVGATLVRKFSPPALGSETRVMLGFISAEQDEALVFYQCFQGGEATMTRDKGAQKASLTGTTWDVEVPDPLVSPDDWNYYTAGANFAVLT